MSNKKKFVSMKWQIIGVITPVIIVVTFVILFILFLKVKTTLKDEIEERLQTECDSISNEVESWSDQALIAINTIADIVQDDRIRDTDTLIEYLTGTTDIVPGCGALYVVYTDGTCISKDGVESFPEYLDEDWYLHAISSDVPSFDECSYYTEDGLTEYSVTVARNMKDSSGKVIGLVATDMQFTFIRDTIMQASEMHNSQFVLIDSLSGIIIAATDTDLEGEFLNEIDNTLIQNIESDFESGAVKKIYQSDNKNEVVMASNVKGTEWNLLVYEDEDSAMAAMESISLLSFLGNIAMVLIVAAACAIVVERQMRQLTRAKDDIMTVSSGDLTVEMDVKESGVENEIHSMRRSLKHYIEKMHNLIRGINDTSVRLGDHAKIFGNMAGDMNNSTKVQYDSLSQLTEAIESITQSTQSMAQQATNLSSLASATADSSNSIKDKMVKMEENSVRTSEELNQVSKKMSLAEESMDSLVNLVDQVSDVTKEINSITDVIKDIASETNLLSLNASIEAARAGEVGKGFAVVAEQIKSLAETCNENAVNIEQLVENISGLMEQTGKSTRVSAGDIKESGVVLKEIVESYKHTVEDVKTATAEIESMLKNTKEVDTISTEMADATSVQASGSQEILATTVEIERLVKAAEQQSSQLKQGADAISLVADDLINEMSYFKVKG